MKVKTHYPVRTYIGTCSKCNTEHLATEYGDAVIEGVPVCAHCQRQPTATERSEGARPTERSEGGSTTPNA